MTTVHERGLHLRSLGHEVAGAVNAGLGKAREIVHKHPIRTVTGSAILVGLAAASVGVATLRQVPPPASANEMSQAQSGTVLPPPADLPSVGQLVDQRPTTGAAGGEGGNGEPPKQPETGLPGVLPDELGQPSTEGPPEGGEGGGEGDGEPPQPEADNSAVSESAPEEPQAVETGQQPAVRRTEVSRELVEEYPQQRPDGTTIYVKKFEVTFSNGQTEDRYEIVLPAGSAPPPPPAAAPAPARADQGEHTDSFTPRFNTYKDQGLVSAETEVFVKSNIQQYLAKMASIPELAGTANAIMTANSEQQLRFHIVTRTKWSEPEKRSDLRYGPVAFDLSISTDRTGKKVIVYQFFWRESAMKMVYNNPKNVYSFLKIYEQRRFAELFKEFVQSDKLSPEEAYDLAAKKILDDGNKLRMYAQAFGESIDLYKTLKGQLKELGLTYDEPYWESRLQARERDRNNEEAWLATVRRNVSSRRKKTYPLSRNRTPLRKVA